MAHLYKKDQGRYWESEIPDDKIISITPHTFSSVIVSYVDKDGRTREIICDKIALI